MDTQNDSAALLHSFNEAALRMQRRLRGRSTILACPPEQPDAFLEATLAALSAGLAEMSAALASGEITVQGGAIHIARTRTPSPARETLPPYAAVNRMLRQTRLTDLLERVDAATEYSKAILRRAPRSAGERSDLYAALLVHGTEIETSEIARVIPQAGLEGVPQMMRLLANRERLRHANERVVAFLCRHPNAGSAVPTLSAGSACLALAWRLWKAAYDPRHHRQAIPAYAGFIGRHGIPRDLPIAAPEGAIQQTVASLLARCELDAALVDEASGIVIGKLIGLDVFTPSRASAQRRLWVPAGSAVSPGLQATVSEGVSLPAIRKGWQSLARLGQLLVRGDPGQEPRELAHLRATSCVAERHLGRLIRTLHACMYYSNGAFRAALQQSFSEQQRLEALRQAIYHGPARARRRQYESMPPSSAETLTLLTNIFLAGALTASRTSGAGPNPSAGT